MAVVPSLIRFVRVCVVCKWMGQREKDKQKGGVRRPDVLTQLVPEVGQLLRQLLLLLQGLLTLQREED